MASMAKPSASTLGHCREDAAASRCPNAILLRCCSQLHQRIRILQIDFQRRLEATGKSRLRHGPAQRHLRRAGGAKIQSVDSPGTGIAAQDGGILLQRACRPARSVRKLNSTFAGIAAQLGTAAISARKLASNRTGSVTLSSPATRGTCRHRAVGPRAPREAKAASRNGAPHCQPFQRSLLCTVARLKLIEPGDDGISLDLGNSATGWQQPPLALTGELSVSAPSKCGARAWKLRHTFKIGGYGPRAGIDIEVDASADAVGAVAGGDPKRVTSLRG